MKVHEYQAKEILKAFGVPVPEGKVAETPAEAKAIAEQLGGTVVVKAQIHAGGRGKGGGIKLAHSPEEAEKAADEILGMTLVTHQTGPEGKLVGKVLVEAGSDIECELYLGAVLDRSKSMPAIMVSQEGGMEIEEVAKNTPEKIITRRINPTTGLRSFQLRELAYALGLEGDSFKQGMAAIKGLYNMFMEKDCNLAEINPLIVTKDGQVLALDAKLNFDDHALYRQKDVAEMRDTTEEDPLEVEASKNNLNYIKLDGNIGCMVNGAGLAMATMDMIMGVGQEPANFLDVGGGASQEMVENAFRILLNDPNVEGVLINIFGGILRCDVLAKGIVEASKKLELKVPMVIRLEGTNVEEGRKILAESGLDFNVARDFKEAAEKVAQMVK